MVAFLGHIVCSEGVKVDPRKTEVVKSWPRPFNPTDIKIFLGLAGYDRIFVEGFSSITSSLMALIQNKSKFKLLELC